jgi:hypothetical protein
MSETELAVGAALAIAAGLAYYEYKKPTPKPPAPSSGPTFGDMQSFLWGRTAPPPYVNQADTDAWNAAQTAAQESYGDAIKANLWGIDYLVKAQQLNSTDANMTAIAQNAFNCHQYKGCTGSGQMVYAAFVPTTGPGWEQFGQLLAPLVGDYRNGYKYPTAATCCASTNDAPPGFGFASPWYYVDQNLQSRAAGGYANPGGPTTS